MKKIALTIVISGLVYSAGISNQAHANQTLLSEMFGRGIHAYYVGNQDDAKKLFTSAIENGLEDPRVYYFRGIVAFESGSSEQAVNDWKRGAEIEANSRVNYVVGKSLARFQGNGRVQLESIRQAAKLAAYQARLKRAETRYGELAANPNPPSASTKGITPPPIPSDIVNPFAADAASGQASVVDNDALKNAMNDPFAGEANAAPANPNTAPAKDPFGGGGADNDPFGGAAGGNDPFGGAADKDPFGGNPFGN